MTTAHNNTLTVRDSFLAVFLLCSFGANAVAVKIAYGGIGVFTTAGVRFALAAVFIVIWALATKRPLAMERKNLVRALVMGVAFTAQLGLFYQGISRTSATKAILIGNIQPFFLLFMAHFFIPGDTFTARKLGGVILGVAGIVVLADPASIAGGAWNPGDLMILAATILWAASAVYIKLIIDEIMPYQVVLYQLTVAVPVYLIGGCLFDSAMVFDLNWKVIASMAFQSAVTGSYGFIAWNVLVKKYGAVALHSYLFIMPIAGVSLSWFLLDEPVTPMVFASLALVVAGIIVVNAKSDESNPFVRWIRRI